jgi:DNA-binding transcriptional LysR family regulator
MDKFAAMRAFVCIVDKGSLTAAADALDTSLPTVVRTLAALERELGARLLNRTTRHLHLTDEGARYLDHCRQVLASMQDFESGIMSAKTQPRGRLSVTASVLFGRRYIAPIAAGFVQRYPEVSFNLLFVDRVVNVIEEGIDVAIRIGHLREASLVAVRVGAVRRVICASPPYLKHHGTPRKPAQVASYPCVRHTGLAPHGEWHFRVGQRNVAIPVNAIITCNEIDSALNACIGGAGLGMFLSYQASDYRKSGELRYVLEAFEVEPLPVQVVFPQTKLLSAAVRTFVDECVKTLRQVNFD